MEAVMTRPRQSYKFDHKLTHDEIERLIEDYDYTSEYEDDGGAIWDKFGNPTEATIRAMYEGRHDIGTGPMTFDEFSSLLDEWREESDDEDADIPYVV